MYREDELKQIKEQYNNIEVPQEALRATLNGIRRAKREQQNTRRTRSMQRWAAAAAVLALVAVPNLSMQAAMAISEIPGLDKVVQVITLNRYTNGDGIQQEAAVETPMLQAQGGAMLQSSVGEINDSVRAWADQLIAQYEADAQEGGMQALDVRYNVVTDTDNWFALQVTATETMADSAETVRYYNLNKETGAVAHLADVFPEGTDYVTTISENVKQQMRQRMQETAQGTDENGTYFIDTDMPDEDFQQIAADQNFYINQDGQLVIVFDQYEVAPGYMGVQEFVVPIQ